MQPRFGDLTWTTPQKFCSDFVPSCFPYQIETFGKVLVLILMGRISSIIWVIWMGSDTQADTNFQVRFYVMMFPDHSAVFARIEMGKVILNRLYLFLAWNSPNFCVILYLLFNVFYFGHFQKENQINPINNTMSLQSAIVIFAG